MKINIRKLLGISPFHLKRLYNNGSGLMSCWCGCGIKYQMHACAYDGMTFVNNKKGWENHKHGRWCSPWRGRQFVYTCSKCRHKDIGETAALRHYENRHTKIFI